MTIGALRKLFGGRSDTLRVEVLEAVNDVKAALLAIDVASHARLPDNERTLDVLHRSGHGHLAGAARAGDLDSLYDELADRVRAYDRARAKLARKRPHDPRTVDGYGFTNPEWSRTPLAPRHLDTPT